MLPEEVISQEISYTRYSFIDMDDLKNKRNMQNSRENTHSCKTAPVLGAWPGWARRLGD